MKTKKIISAMVQCISNKSCIGCIYEYDDNCHKAIMEDAKNRLMDYVAEIDGLKKNVEKLKKELAERETAPGWISVEERMPEEGQRCFIDVDGGLWISVFNKGTFGNKDANHWMPVPKPPEQTKKVKTYADVYWERMKTAFPNLDIIIGRIPAFCRSELFEEDIECEGIGGYCKECWEQPYEEEEGGSE